MIETDFKGRKNRIGLTDEIESLLEVLVEILIIRIGGWNLSVDNAPCLVISRQLGGDVYDSRDSESLEKLEVGGVPAIAEVKEGKNLRRRMIVDVRQLRRARRCRAADETRMNEAGRPSADLGGTRRRVSGKNTAFAGIQLSALAVFGFLCKGKTITVIFIASLFIDLILG